MSEDIERTFASIQHHAISEALHLFDGFYENLEHGLFELAHQLDDQAIQHRCAATAKELRRQKVKTLRKLTKLMEADQTLWVSGSSDRDGNRDLLIAARSLARKHATHFAAVLRSISRRVAVATDRHHAEVEIPITPEHIAYHFLCCMSDSRNDADISPMLNDLFGRLVLGRLGSIYGRINSQLSTFEDAFAGQEAEVA